MVLALSYQLHVVSHVDSALETTRVFWRRKLGFPDSIVNDPRPLAEALAAPPPQPSPLQGEGDAESGAPG